MFAELTIIESKTYEVQDIAGWEGYVASYFGPLSLSGGTIGSCCGAKVISSNWTDIHTPNTICKDKWDAVDGYSKLTKKEQEYVLQYYGTLPNGIKDTSTIVFTQGRGKAEVLDKAYSPEYQMSHKIGTFTIDDEDSGVLTVSWAEEP